MEQSVTIVAQIQIAGVNPYVLVSYDQADLLSTGWRKPMPVLVQLNEDASTQWQTNMMPNGLGDFYLYLHGEMRQKSNTKVGDTVSVRLRFNQLYRNGPLHPMPDWFQTGLDNNPAAENNWSRLPPSRKKEVLRYFDGLKSDEAKARNVTRAIFVLEGNNGRFMGRDWTNGQ